MGTVRLLWRHERPEPARRGRPPKSTVDDVVRAGIAVADRTGTLAFGLREVAGEIGVAVRSLYSYVSGRDELLQLMIDDCRRTMDAAPLSGPWRTRLRQVAEENLRLFRRHPWLVEVESEREILGPGTLAKYERELGAVEPLRISDVEKDAALGLVLDFVRASARAMIHAERERAEETPEAWWAREGADLAALGIAERFPLAQRIGTAAGEHQGAARDAGHAHRFGLEVVLDGIDARQASAGTGDPAVQGD